MTKIVRKTTKTVAASKSTKGEPKTSVSKRIAARVAAAAKKPATKKASPATAKKATAKTTKKAAAASATATKKGAGRKSAVDGKVIVATKANPLKEGSLRFASWNLIAKAGKKGITYADYKSAGGRPFDLRHALATGFAVAK